MQFSDSDGCRVVLLVGAGTTIGGALAERNSGV